MAAISRTTALTGFPFGEEPDDWSEIESAIYDAFYLNGRHVIDKMCDAFLRQAKENGLKVEDNEGNLDIDVLDDLTTTICNAIWFGLTEGYVTLTGRPFSIPRQFMPSTWSPI